MRKYLIDKTIFLLIGIILYLLIPFIFSGIINIVLRIVLILSWVYLCRRLLLFPLDLIVGQIERIVYFSSQNCGEEYEFFRHKFCYEWKFYYDNEETLKLIVPDGVVGMNPITDRRIVVVYYKFSKILVKWQYV